MWKAARTVTTPSKPVGTWIMINCEESRKQLQKTIASENQLLKTQQTLPQKPTDSLDGSNNTKKDSKKSSKNSNNHFPSETKPLTWSHWIGMSWRSAITMRFNRRSQLRKPS